MRIVIKSEKLVEAKRLMDEYGLSRERAATTVGITLHALRCYLNPDYKRQRALKQRSRASEFVGDYESRRKYKTEGTLGRHAVHFEVRTAPPPADILYERDRRMALPYRDLTGAIFGDPKPGYSALDKKQGMWK